MKKAVALSLTLLMLSMISASAFALRSDVVSPALEIIASDNNMIKSGPEGRDITFTLDDFEAAAGIIPSSVTITSLPPVGDGILMLGSGVVTVNQTISSGNLNLLRFVPADGVCETSFRFTHNRTYTTECQIKILQGTNSSPSAGENIEKIAAWTQMDVSCFGKLPGYDPEDDSITFEIVSYPDKGLLTITDKEFGNYKYTPYKGVTGVDSFSYRIMDEYGNYSEEYSIPVKIDKRAAEIVLADMDDHWAYNAAISMIADSSMSAFSESGTLLFKPDEPVSRQDFITTVMKSLGCGTLSAKNTIFADNDKINDENSGYIAAAYRLGIIKGERSEAGLNFRPDDMINRAEAAAVLNRIIGAEMPAIATAFADNSSIPSWASVDMYALSELGIITGTGMGNIMPSENISRAQTAQILFTIKNLYDCE